MGTLVEGCACNNCNKEEPNDDESESESISNIYDDNNRLNSLSRSEIPKNIVDMKFQTGSLVKEYFCNPFDVYKELEELGEGAYGVVKKVCLINNPDTVRAMKIISKEDIVQGQSQQLIDEIKILRK